MEETIKSVFFEIIEASEKACREIAQAAVAATCSVLEAAEAFARIAQEGHSARDAISSFVDATHEAQQDG